MSRVDLWQDWHEEDAQRRKNVWPPRFGSVFCLDVVSSGLTGPPLDASVLLGAEEYTASYCCMLRRPPSMHLASALEAWADAACDRRTIDAFPDEL